MKEQRDLTESAVGGGLQGPLDAVGDQDARLDLAGAVAGRTLLGRLDVGHLTDSLAGDLHHTETARGKHIVLGLVRLHGLAEGFRQLAAVLHLPHVDEVHGDDAAHVPQTQEPGDFLGALQVGGGGVLLLGGRAGLPSTGVHVDHMHGLGVLDDEVGSTPEVDLAAEARLDHPVHAAVIEDILGLGQLDDVHLVRRVGREVFLDLLGHFRVVDQDLGEVRIEQIPEEGARLVDLAEDPLAVLGPPQVLVEFLPAVGEILEVSMQVCRALLLRHRSHDDAKSRRLDALHQPLEASPLLFTLDA